MQHFIQEIGKAIATISIVVAGLFGFSPSTAPVENVGATIPIPVAVFQTSLQASITETATSMTLVDGKDKAGNNISGYICFNIDEGTSIEEFVCGTVSGTSVTSMIRGIDPVDGDLEVTALKKTHRRGTSVKVTNYPSLGIISRILNGNETFPNIISYNSHPSFTSDTQIIDKKYADDLAYVTGSPDANSTTKGLVEEATQAEIDAGTIAGSTLARLYQNPSTIRAKQYHDYAVDSVGSDSYAITITPAITAYSVGQVFTFKAGTANTGSASLNVSGLGAKTIKKDVSSDLVTGDILANQIVMVEYDGTNMQMISHISPLIPIVRTYLTATSPATWTKPAGLRYIITEVQAGGGGGGGNTTASDTSGGGGGGGYSKKLIVASSLGATETVTIGAGGTAGAGTGGTGGTGGSSSFGTHATATGGTGGVASGVGGTGGVGSSGDININGSAGGVGTQFDNLINSGIGGSSHLGGGAPGVGYDTVGVAGGLYGGGGSGASSQGNDYAGGVGGAGIVIVTEYY